MTKRTIAPIDVDKLPKHFEAAQAEARWDGVWDTNAVNRWDPSRPREETFVVDTPPPTVSGSLHIGHVFSYTHTDILVRQQRMRGRNVFYPMGWDDNGLPTERRVQNLFHVRCDPREPYVPGLAETLQPADSKTEKERPRLLSRQSFIELCHRVTKEDEKVFTALFRRIGLSVDWSTEYATIDDRSRHLAQLSFIDLFDKKQIYNVEAPTMWDVDFQTAVAQAELEDRPKTGAFHEIAFKVEGTDRTFVIATTRPELLPACVGVTAHPDDERYRDLFGKTAITPLFSAPVKIFPSELADPKKGTGILMVCTFGDATDVQWWREQKLPMRQILGRNGRVAPIRFGPSGSENTGEFESRDPEAANKAFAELEGKTVHSAQQAIVAQLKSSGALQGDPKPTQQNVKFFEKGDRPLEFITTRQWFVKLMDKKEQLLAKGDEIRWHPDFMRLRYRNWTENLQLDWCVSRQRYFGVPFPVWYPVDAEGRIQYDRPIVAPKDMLPTDPMSVTPPGFKPEQRDQPNGFAGEPDVFDTWFTSSLTPQIGSHWELDLNRHKKLFPADIRPQSHEIIRTWAFYTIAKALIHDDDVPWHNVVISGWILDPDRKKMSKSKGNVVTPMHLLDEYTADGVRYWAANARLGIDTAFDEQVLKVGKRLVTKIFNAGKLVLQQGGEAGPITSELDRSFLAKLRVVVENASAAFSEFEYAKALMETEQFFWSSFTDAYLELTKARARGEGGNPDDQASALSALRLATSVLLRLFAPFLPYITEEVWSWAFAAESGHASIHRAPWPGPRDFDGVAAPSHEGTFELAARALGALHKRKSEAGVSIGRPIASCTAAVHPGSLAMLREAEADLRAAARCRGLELVGADNLEPNAFEVREIAFEDQPPKSA